ncbi:MAG: ABC transporter permease [Rhodospirillaceae bacterium]|nr:ABC transporter permease [Rhodospirillaceae bacterium]
MSFAPPRHRRVGPINWIGLATLYFKEVRRFAKVATQTVIAPVITSLLFLAIFSLALGRTVQTIGGVSFAEFLAPGLIMMSMVQNAFANTSSSIMISKVQGSIVDLLMPPLSPGEIVVAMVLGGVTRGIAVGLAAVIGMSFFVPIAVHDAGFILFHAIAASLLLAQLGILGGIWAEKFDHIAAITNFVITPFAFLSGAFYSVQRLPEPWITIAHWNPFFYMIDGFRYGFIGHADGSLTVGMLLLIAANGLMLWLNWRLIAIGYKLRP